jgi:hypothetical protein
MAVKEFSEEKLQEFWPFLANISNNITLHLLAGNTSVPTELGSATLKCSAATATATCSKCSGRYRYRYTQ